MIGDMPFLMSRDTYLPLIAIKPENSAVSPQHLSPAPYETGKPAITGPSHRLSTQPFTTAIAFHPQPQWSCRVATANSTQNLKIVPAAILCETNTTPSHLNTGERQG